MLAIFDMDGTLVDSSITLTNAINYVREKLELKSLDGQTILEQINNPNCDLARFFYESDEITDKHEEWFQGYYSKNHDKELVLFDGVELMLNNLRDKGIKVALATNAYRVSTMEALEHLNIDNYFDDIICYDEVENGKPAPDMLLALLHRSNAKRVVFIGDSDRDMLAAKAANLEFYRVAFGSNDRKSITKADILERKIVDFLYNKNNLVKR